MKKPLDIGMSQTIDMIVQKEQTAEQFGSGGVLVFATPCLVLLMEQAAHGAVDNAMDVGFTTVGTAVDIKHIAATPVGMKVCAKAILAQVDNRRLVFSVEAWDEKEIIGTGTHERFIIEKEKFMQKALGKKSNG